MSEQVKLVIQAWHTECGACGYGRGGWASSPARKGKPILTPQSRECPGCARSFTHVEDPYGGTLEPISDRDGHEAPSSAARRSPPTERAATPSSVHHDGTMARQGHPPASADGRPRSQEGVRPSQIRHSSHEIRALQDASPVGGGQEPEGAVADRADFWGGEAA